MRSSSVDGLAQLASVVNRSSTRTRRKTNHNKARREERFAHRHLHLSALAEHAEQAIANHFQQIGEHGRLQVLAAGRKPSEALRSRVARRRRLWSSSWSTDVRMFRIE